MLHADNPLLHQIIASFNDPDPDRALRFRPFVYGGRRYRLAAQSGLNAPVSLRPGERLRELFGTVPRLVMSRRAESAPCCSTACC